MATSQFSTYLKIITTDYKDYRSQLSRLKSFNLSENWLQRQFLSLSSQFSTDFLN